MSTSISSPPASGKQTRTAETPLPKTVVPPAAPVEGFPPTKEREENWGDRFAVFCLTSGFGLLVLILFVDSLLRIIPR